MSQKKIRARDRDAILQSLRAGVVPRRGQHHIQVGRSEEVKALLQDIERIADGGSGVRFVIGEYGSGKTFFLQLIRAVALEQGLVASNADLNPDRRLHASKGQARSLYAELMANLATRTRPDGGAITSIVERFLTQAQKTAQKEGKRPEAVLRAHLEELSEMVGGYDFAEVIAAYWRGHDEGDDRLMSAAVRWLRGEYTTRTDARKALGVRTIVDDDNVYDQLKLFARFVRLAGYEGLLLCLDEMVNLYKLSHTGARTSNYEQILRIVNDSLQGSSVGLGFLFGGTPEFLMDPRRGLYSYEALQTRLAENSFANGELRDFSSPVLRLASLSQEELYVLLSNLRHVHAGGDPERHLLPDDGLHAFMHHCFQRIGEAYFRTPRNTIKAFVDLLAILDQNPQTDWKDLLPRIEVEEDTGPAADILGSLDEEEEEAEEAAPPVSAPDGAAPSRRGPLEDLLTPQDDPDDDLTSFKL